MLYYLIAGEASGDLHGSNLMKEIIALDENARFRFWGGHKMGEVAKQEPVVHISHLAFMGFKEVLLNIRAILKNLSYCKKDIKSYKPDVLILIDYPGFNMRMAKFAKKQGIKVVYYIAPQVWAWKQSRVKALRRYVDKLLVILPFETEFFSGFGVNNVFVGHPLLDEIEKFKRHLPSVRKEDYDKNKPVIAIMPGSRKQEIKSSLPIMAQVANNYPDHNFVIAGLSVNGIEFYNRILHKQGAPANLKVVLDQTYSLLSHSTAALVTSGTATLETAIFNVPQVVCYRGGRLSYLVAKRLIKSKFISLVNLVSNKEVVKELIQKDFNEKTLETELHNLLFNNHYRDKMLDEYQNVKNLIGGTGASKKAATESVGLASLKQSFS